jgi:hypothetical protein
VATALAADAALKAANVSEQTGREARETLAAALEPALTVQLGVYTLVLSIPAPSRSSLAARRATATPFLNSPSAELRVVQGGQHFLSASNPDDVNTATTEFINRWK